MKKLLTASVCLVLVFLLGFCLLSDKHIMVLSDPSAMKSVGVSVIYDNGKWQQYWDYDEAALADYLSSCRAVRVSYYWDGMAYKGSDEVIHIGFVEENTGFVNVEIGDYCLVIKGHGIYEVENGQQVLEDLEELLDVDVGNIKVIPYSSR